MIYSSNFLPCIAYFSSCIYESEIKINIAEQYRKQTYKNRANILGPHKIEQIIVPVLKNKNNTKIKDIRIDDKENWQRIAWRTISTCYKNSPYFQYYDYLFQPIFENRFEFLIDLNHAALLVCLKTLQINKTICLEEFSFEAYKNDCIDFNAKKKNENHDFFTPIIYNQNFGKEFEPNLSIIDLIFCKGTESIDILKKSRII